jgi:aldose 1-epimerase
MSEQQPVVIRDGDLEITVDSAVGARLSSLRLGGLELLRTVEQLTKPAPVFYGSYPMAPFAGRIGHGKLEFQGSTYQLPTNLGDHAGHGVVMDQPWEYLGPDTGIHTWTINTDDRWPFPCAVTQTAAINDGALRLTLRIDASQDSPAWAGWHPWWRRRLDRGDEVQIDLPARTMLERRDELPTGNRHGMTEGPWDDAFTDLDGPILLTWPSAARVELTSDHRWWVVYTEQPDAIAVEPQSAPPNAQALGLAATVGPDHPLSISTLWRFERL